MSTIESEIGAYFSRPETAGPITKRRLRRTLIIYVAMIVIGLLPVLVQAPASWQAAGLGLWLPGAGFVVTGGWMAIFFPVTLVLFTISIVAWFWAGMLIAPLLVWIGSACLAAVVAPDAVWLPAHMVIAAIISVGAIIVAKQIQLRHVRDEQKAQLRATYIGPSMVEVNARSAKVLEPSTREMTEDQLASLRYLLDRSLQPIERFDGFTIIDQFQPAAIRYQLNHMGYALGIAQGAYTPNFKGYMHTAQRNLIDKYLLKRVWDYWIYESCWGNFNFTDFDPAARDNIMLTGWFGMQVGQYMLSSGDRRYAEPGSLTFRLNDRVHYPHDQHTIAGSIADNYQHYEDGFYIYACEPNFVYPICNHYGMATLANHDRLFDTDYLGELLPKWLDKMDEEFTDRSGSIIGLRSQLTGIEFPFPSSDIGYATFANCFAPERAQKHWAIARKELQRTIVQDHEGLHRITLSGEGIDPGNYKRGQGGVYASILSCAQEFGDTEIAEAAQRSLDQDCQPDFSQGALGYLGASNLTNANIATGRLMRTGDFRRSFVVGPSQDGLSGPCLGEVPYPDVLVAKATSDGSNLTLVLYPGAEDKNQSLPIHNLNPNTIYAVSGGANHSIQTDAEGRAQISVQIKGKTELVVEPVAT